MENLIRQECNQVAIVSLGCDKNRVDTERMLYNLTSSGYTFTSEFSLADIIIINTCAFLSSARKEAIDNILSLAEYKKQGVGVCKHLIVTGCLPQKHVKDGIANELPEVDGFLGVGAYDDIVAILDTIKQGKKCIEVSKKDNQSIDRFVTTPMHYAYLKVAEGCDSHCTFCTIPYIRGAYVSRDLDGLVLESTKLADKGVKELILVAQDVTNYGKDNGSSLIELLNKLSMIKGIEWIRLMYCYPDLVNLNLIKEISKNNKIAKYIDIPLQHISDKILRLMGRRNNKKQAIDLIENIRAIDTDIAIRSTFITGFPNESELEHNELCEFLNKYSLDHVGFFKYSREQDTKAYDLPFQNSMKIKNTRLKELATIQKRKTVVNLNNKLGQIVRVLYEDIDYKKQLFIGRTEQNAPDIDTLIYFSGGNVEVGQFYNVKIIGVSGYDLIGQLV